MAGIKVDKERYLRPARFEVTDNVVNKDVGPFTATISAFGNALTSADFEPSNYRTRFFAEADSPDSIILSPSAITGYDMLKEGFYDGAEVRIYRIIDGKFRIIRRDRIPEGGSFMSGWMETGTNDRKLVSPAKPTYTYRFDDWNRPNVPYWFSVAAVAPDGRLSVRSDAISHTLEAGKRKKSATPTEMLSFKASEEVTGMTLVPPTGLKAEFEPESRSLALKWDPVKGASGYRIFRSDYVPGSHKGYELKLAGKGEAIKKGDWIIVSKEFKSFSRKKYQSNRVWDSHQNKAAMPDGVPVFPDEDENVTWQLEPRDGQHCIRFDLKAGGRVALNNYNHSSTTQTWYPVLHPGIPYKIEFLAKQKNMADSNIIFKLNGFYKREVQPITFSIGKEWKQYEATFTVNELYKKNSGVGQTSLSFEGPGSVWLDNYRIYRTDTPFLDYFPYEYRALKESGMSSLRTHAFIKTGTSSYDMQQFTNPGGSVSGIHHGNTLPQTLEMMDKTGVVPWLQVEMHMTPEEWLGFVEYMAAPTISKEETPWAWKRKLQGHKKPWTENFDKIYFEISNETWNWLFNPWVFESMTDGTTGKRYNRGEVYGLFQEHVIECLKASPYWKNCENKFEFVLGGWRVQEYGLKAGTTSPNSEWITRAGYNGGWDEGEGPAEGNDSSLFRIMMQCGQTAEPAAVTMKNKRDEMAPQARLGTYEAGPGYALSGLNGQKRMSKEEVRLQEESMKSLAGGTATLDTFLCRAYNDYDIQNFFTFYHGKTHWVSHTAWHKGSIAYPCWMTLALFNNEGTGNMLEVMQQSAPTIDMPAHKRRKAMNDIPLISCYATRRGQRLNLFILSRKLDNYPVPGDNGITPVTIKLPLKSAAKITLFSMTGDPRNHNLDRQEVKIEKKTVKSGLQDGVFTVEEGIPPGATLLYVFE